MNNPRIIIGILIIIAGLSFLLDLDLFRIVIPLFIIYIGYKVITGKSGEAFIDDKTPSNENEVKRVMVFSGINKKFTSADFQGMDLTVAFGGGEVDLSQVKTSLNKLELNFVATFGGMKVIVPKNWRVKSEGVGVIGGFTNNSTNSSTKKSIDVTIKGVAVFGGVEIVS